MNANRSFVCTTLLVLLAQFTVLAPSSAISQEETTKSDVLTRLDAATERIVTLRYATPVEIASFFNKFLEQDQFVVAEDKAFKQTRIYLHTDEVSPGKLVQIIDDDVLDIDWEEDKFVIQSPDGDDTLKCGGGFLGGSFGSSGSYENLSSLWDNVKLHRINCRFQNDPVSKLLNKINTRLKTDLLTLSNKLKKNEPRITLNTGFANARDVLEWLRRTQCFFYKYEGKKKGWVIKDLSNAEPVVSLEANLKSPQLTRIASGLFSGLRLGETDYLLRMDLSSVLRWDQDRISDHVQTTVNPSIWKKKKNEINNYRRNFIFLRCDDTDTRNATLRYLRNLQLSFLTTRTTSKDWQNCLAALKHTVDGEQARGMSLSEKITNVSLRWITEGLCKSVKEVRSAYRSGNHKKLVTSFLKLRENSLYKISLPVVHRLRTTVENPIRKDKNVQEFFEQQIKNLSKKSFQVRKRSFSILKCAGRLAGPSLENTGPEDNPEAKSRLRILRNELQPMPPVPKQPDSTIVVKKGD